MAKQFELKVVQDEQGNPFDYRKVLIDILRIRQQGMDLAEMETALGCIKAIRAANGTVVLENEQHTYLMTRINENRWVIADPCIVGFVHTVKDAPAYELTPQG